MVRQEGKARSGKKYSIIQELLFVCLLLSSVIVSFSCNNVRQEPATPVFIVKGRTIISEQGAKTARETLRILINKTNPAGRFSSIVIDYPFKNSVFPPEIVAPTFLWHDSLINAGNWLVAIRFDSSDTRLYTLTDGRHSSAGRLDSECIHDNNRWEESPRQKSAHAWTPDSGLWRKIKEYSVGISARIDLYGVTTIPGESPSVCSHGTITITTSRDPVGAPIFYRDVPLMPARNPSGVIQPLSQGALPLIAWRLRDIAKDSAPVVMKHMPTCINCHSFSSDGHTLGMDMDGPQGDKGAYALVPTSQRIMVQRSDVFSWNKFNPEQNTFGLFSRVSPDGRYVASAVDEEVHVVNYMDFRFLQTFYPTRGKIAIYDRQLKKIRTLTGADETEYVQCNPVWSPDGKWIVFLRARARPAFSGPRSSFANDPCETQIKYDLYRIPFNNGKGGVAEPIQGAFNTGKSVSFPKYSPDGKWIVFVQANIGLLMRPDSRLYIIPADGGKARELQCNLPLMNSWHSWSPNSRWLVFSSKSFTPFTQMFLTHIDDSGNASPAVLIPNSTAINRAVNLPEFVNMAGDGISSILTPAVDYKIHFDRGKKFLDKENADSAYAEIMKAIALKPDYAENYSVLTFILARQGKIREALQACSSAVELDPANELVHLNAGMLLYALERMPESIEHLELAIKLNPNSAIAHYYLGLAYETEKNLEDALIQLDDAIRCDSVLTDAYNKRGTIFFKTQKYDRAIDNFSRAIAISPKVKLYQNRAVAFAAKNEYQSVMDDLTRAEKMEPGNGMTCFVRGNTLLQMGKIDSALANFKAALDCKKVHIQAVEPYCEILFSMDKHADAIPLLEKMNIKYPQNAMIVNRRAIAYMNIGEVTKAIADFDFVLSKAPEEASAYFNKALCYEKQGNLDSAIKNYSLVMRFGSPHAKQYSYAKKKIRELKR